MYQKVKLAAVGIVALALTACSGNGSSMPMVKVPTQSVSGGVDFSKVHIMRTMNAPAPHIDAPQTLQYFGGPIEHKPKEYLIFWGFNVSGSDPSGEKAYATSFFQGLGGSPWVNTDHQYYMGTGTHVHIKNLANQLGGTWVDSSSVPSSPSDSQIRAEAASGEAHFGYHKDGNYVVFTPHNHNSPGFGFSFCAYHSPTTSGGGEISYTNMPYITDAGRSCGENSVNPGSGGLLDGVSIVGGHEDAEAQTDPQVNLNTAWANNSYGEIGDICAWQGLANITLSTGKFAVQPLWSNAVSACVLHSP